ncbi:MULTISPECIES: glycosyltransferase family 4 protein [Protofrankia]|uniref:Glycosyl transferase group 1 n=1 Tax=Candidatus Protofrankia datiscae TaxID=2716812 RepID=F8AWD3_9ACTN|nr:MULTISPECIES: glycosyltransferase family 4 protein [Protofrankia]AEH08334.1 glycosyl transferase group 1 [Candidatus Protofrankia datiscae]
MKILLLAQFFPPIVGGEERHVHNLGRRLADRHEVTVVTFGDKTGTATRDGMRVRTIRPITASLPFLYGEGDRLYAPPLPDPAVARALRRVIVEERPDVIHAHNWIVNSLTPLRLTTRAPMVLTLHDYSHVCATKRFMYLGQQVCAGPSPRRCVRCAHDHYGGPVGLATVAGNQGGRALRRLALNRIIAVSSAVARHSDLAAGGIPFEVIPNFIPDELLETRSHTVPGGMTAGGYLLYVGDLSRDKGVGILLDAYARLAADRPPLLMVGRRTPHLPDRLPAGVVVAEPWDHEKIMQAFAGAAFAVVPSIWPDPCPTVVLEAMAAGVPVVTTGMGGIADMVRDGEDGVVVPPSEPAALAAAMNLLLADPSLRQRLGRRARDRAASFTAGEVVPRIEAVYRDLVHAR